MSRHESPRARRPVAAAAWGPAVVVLLGAAFVMVAAYRSTFAILGRDQGIFQYVAWAIGHGEKLYRDIREFNGPLVDLVHMVFLALGGADEHVFRTLDMALSSLVFFACGAALPGIGQPRQGERPRVSLARRALWGAAAWVLLTAQYVSFGFWHTAQRESFFNLALLPSIALQLRAQGAFPSLPAEAGPAGAAGRWRGLTLALAAGLGTLAAFGKPHNLLYSLFAFSVLLADDDPSWSRAQRAAWFGVGSAAATAAMVAFTAAIGDPREGARIVLFEVPRIYRWIWKRSPAEALTAFDGNARRLAAGLAISAVVAVALWTRALPRRAALLLCLPLVGTAAFFVQAKGFPYHLHPVVAGTTLAALGLLVAASERADRAGGGRRWQAATAAGAAMLGLAAIALAIRSDAMKGRWFELARTAEGRSSDAYLRSFRTGDYHPADLRQAAAFLRAHTRPDDRVQLYGVDPYLLFLAERKGATPFVYTFDLNVDAALAGGGGSQPGPGDRAHIQAVAERNRARLLEGLAARPPAAIVYLDDTPFTQPADAAAEFARSAPAAAQWIAPRYHEVARIGVVRIWMRQSS